MGIIIGLVVTLGCVLGGYMAMGGHLDVLFQPWELVIIGGAALGTFLVANAFSTIKDTGKACMEAFKYAVPKQSDYLQTLGVLNSLMREMKGKTKSEVEGHIDNPSESTIFQAYPYVMKNVPLTLFICDYCRIIMMGKARPHELEALMDEEIHTNKSDRLKAYHALQAVADGLPALGIVAAVLGIVKAMGALDQSPELLGGLIGAALVGTFLGIFLSYAIVGPIATQVKTVREKQNRMFIVVKQTLIAHMNGAMPQIAIEFGRKTISAYDRPSFDAVEESTMSSGPRDADIAKAA